MKHLSPTDAVPALRGDVVLSQRPTGAGAEVIDIRPIGVGHGTRLHGFELSLARLLDGRRTAQEVVSRATRLGLPLSLPALEGFIEHLERHQLLARTAGEAASAVSPWSQRVEWDEGVRLRYQAALKSLRAGRTREAQAMLDVLLAQAPALDEARALRDWLRSHPDAEDGGESFRETFARAERAWLSGVSSPRAAVTPIPVREEPLAPEELRAVRPSLTPMAVLIALLIIGAVTLLMPIPSVVSVPAQLAPVAVAEISAPLSGTLGEVRVKEGDWVQQGQVLAAYSEPGGVIVTATSIGGVAELNARAGARVTTGQRLLQLEDTRRLKVQAMLDPVQAREVRAGQTATIALGQRHAKTRVDSVEGRALIAEVDNTNNVMEPGHAVIDIDVGWRSLLQRMMR